MIFSTSPEELDIAENVRLAGSAALQAVVDSWEESDELPRLVEETLQTMIFAMSKEKLVDVTIRDVRNELEHRLNLTQDCLRPFWLRLRNSMQRFIDEKEDQEQDGNNSDMASAVHCDEGEQLRALDDEIAKLNNQIAQLSSKILKLQSRRNDVSNKMAELQSRRNDLATIIMSACWAYWENHMSQPSSQSSQPCGPLQKKKNPPLSARVLFCDMM